MGPCRNHFLSLSCRTLLGLIILRIAVIFKESTDKVSSTVPDTNLVTGKMKLLYFEQSHIKMIIYLHFETCHKLLTSIHFLGCQNSVIFHTVLEATSHSAMS
jgi:hypothetical protein